MGYRHIELVANGEVGRGSLAKLELGNAHLVGVVGLGHTHGYGARCEVYRALILVESQ